MGRVSSVWKAFAFFHSQSAIAAYRSSRKRALCQMYRTVLLQEPASWKSKSAKTCLRTRRSSGPGTRGEGLAGLMYSCVWGALAGSASVAGLIVTRVVNQQRPLDFAPVGRRGLCAVIRCGSSDLRKSRRKSIGHASAEAEAHSTDLAGAVGKLRQILGR